MSPNKYRRILQAAYAAVWAIQPEKLRAIIGFLEFANAGGKYTAEEVSARIEPHAAQSPAATTQVPTLAVISIRGIISQRVEMMDDISGPGGTSTERVTKLFRTALNDDSVKAIVFDVDSPGGTVYGVEELSTEIYKARGKKPIVAVVNSLAASAAYWIASSADEMVITPSGDAGSVGVYVMHVDESKALEMEGVAVTFIHAAEFKTEANPYQPLTEEAQAYLQSRVDDYYTMFTKAVARNRGTTVAKVKSDFGKGRVLGAANALAAGMVDRIATFDQTIERLAKSKGPRAELSGIEILAEGPAETVEAEAVTPSVEAGPVEQLEPMNVPAMAETAKPALSHAQRRQELLEAGLI